MEMDGVLDVSLVRFEMLCFSHRASGSWTVSHGGVILAGLLPEHVGLGVSQVMEIVLSN